MADKSDMCLGSGTREEKPKAYSKVIQYRVGPARPTRLRLWTAWKQLSGVEHDTHAIDKAIQEAIIYTRMRKAQEEGHL